MSLLSETVVRIVWVQSILSWFVFCYLNIGLLNFKFF